MECDMFVVLSHCQYQKNGDQNRFTIHDKRYTMSVNSGFDLISNKRYITWEKDWNKIKCLLKDTYSKELKIFEEFICESMAQTNIAIIKKIADILDIKTKIVIDYPTILKGTDRLVDICNFYGATTYLSGKSGMDYLETSKFSESNISVVYQKYGEGDKLPILEVIKNGI